MGSRCIYPHFLDLGTNRRWSAHLATLPLLKETQALLIRKLVGTRNLSGKSGEKKILDPTGA
jgi:hypothetical protein